MKEQEKKIPDKEEWNENVEKCSSCGIKWKKIGKQCPVCYTPAEKVELPCLNCGKVHRFLTNSNEAKGIFNVFCNGECEDKYAFKQ